MIQEDIASYRQLQYPPNEIAKRVRLLGLHRHRQRARDCLATMRMRAEWARGAIVYQQPVTTTATTWTPITVTVPRGGAS